MGKIGKKLRGDKSRERKRAIKTANRAKYDSWRDAGMNSKSHRAKKNKKKGKKASDVQHSIYECGNAGCIKCNPDTRNSGNILSINQTIKFLKDKYPDSVVPMTKRQKKLEARRAA